MARLLPARVHHVVVAIPLRKLDYPLSCALQGGPACDLCLASTPTMVLASMHGILPRSSSSSPRFAILVQITIGHDHSRISDHACAIVGHHDLLLRDRQVQMLS